MTSNSKNITELCKSKEGRNNSPLEHTIFLRFFANNHKLIPERIITGVGTNNFLSHTNTLWHLYQIGGKRDRMDDLGAIL